MRKTGRFFVWVTLVSFFNFTMLPYRVAQASPIETYEEPYNYAPQSWGNAVGEIAKGGGMFLSSFFEPFTEAASTVCSYSRKTSTQEKWDDTIEIARGVYADCKNNPAQNLLFALGLYAGLDGAYQMNGFLEGVKIGYNGTNSLFLDPRFQKLALAVGVLSALPVANTQMEISGVSSTGDPVRSFKNGNYCFSNGTLVSGGGPEPLQVTGVSPGTNVTVALSASGLSEVTNANFFPSSDDPNVSLLGSLRYVISGSVEAVNDVLERLCVSYYSDSELVKSHQFIGEFREGLVLDFPVTTEHCLMVQQPAQELIPTIGECTSPSINNGGNAPFTLENCDIVDLDSLPEDVFVQFIPEGGGCLKYMPNTECTGNVTLAVIADGEVIFVSDGSNTLPDPVGIIRACNGNGGDFCSSWKNVTRGPFTPDLPDSAPVIGECASPPVDNKGSSAFTLSECDISDLDSLPGNVIVQLTSDNACLQTTSNPRCSNVTLLNVQSGDVNFVHDGGNVLGDPVGKMLACSIDPNTGVESCSSLVKVVNGGFRPYDLWKDDTFTGTMGGILSGVILAGGGVLTTCLVKKFGCKNSSEGNEVNLSSGAESGANSVITQTISQSDSENSGIIQRVSESV